ncbi:hypothetical protein DSECCO2_551170 [anaerobic digester metagenome]
MIHRHILPIVLSIHRGLDGQLNFRIAYFVIMRQYVFVVMRFNAVTGLAAEDFFTTDNGRNLKACVVHFGKLLL